MESSSLYETYFDRYTALVPEKSLQEAFNNQDSVLNAYLAKVTEEKSNYAYAPGKWTLKEMLQHMIDTERIFTYRALAIARKDPANLPGFDENLYAENSHTNRRTWEALSREILAVRSSTKFLFESFSPEMLEATGTFNDNEGRVNTLGFIITGHVYHHLRVAEERYFKDLS